MPLDEIKVAELKTDESCWLEEGTAADGERFAEWRPLDRLHRAALAEVERLYAAERERDEARSPRSQAIEQRLRDLAPLTRNVVTLLEAADTIADLKARLEAALRYTRNQDSEEVRLRATIARVEALIEDWGPDYGVSMDLRAALKGEKRDDG